MKDKQPYHQMELAFVPLDLEEYRLVIHLDEPFEPPTLASDAEATRAELVAELLAHLQPEPHRLKLKVMPSTYEEKRRMLQAMLTVRRPDPLPAWFHTRLDQLLQAEAGKRSLAEAPDCLGSLRFGPNLLTKVRRTALYGAATLPG